MAYVSEKVPNSSEAGLEPKPIDWNDFNYPICLKIFHYTPSEIP